MKRPRSNSTEISITIRFPKELVAKIKELAKKHVRSTNGEVIYLVQKAIESDELSQKRE
jgi:predicted transcriptional regulator